VHRIDTWQRMFSAYRHGGKTAPCQDKTFSAELLPCCMSVAMGKVGQVDGLYLVRQVHDRRYILSSWFQWIKSNNWQPSYTCFCEQLSTVITNLDGLNKVAALNNVDDSFSVYLKRFIIGRPKNRLYSVKKILKQFSFVVNVWRKLKSLAPPTNNSHNVSFTGLSHKSSRYFKDFQQVHISILRK
jgi:hypothetical protein